MKTALSPVYVLLKTYDELVKMVVHQNCMVHKHGLIEKVQFQESNWETDKKGRTLERSI